jgi:hypothetical protein
MGCGIDGYRIVGNEDALVLGRGWVCHWYAFALGLHLKQKVHVYDAMLIEGIQNCLCPSARAFMKISWVMGMVIAATYYSSIYVMRLYR